MKTTETQDVIETINPPEEEHVPGSTAVQDDFTATQVVHEEEDDDADVDDLNTQMPSSSVTQIVDNDHHTNEVADDENGINNPAMPQTSTDVAYTESDRAKGIGILEEELKQAKASLAAEKAKCRDAIALNNRNAALKIESMEEKLKSAFSEMESIQGEMFKKDKKIKDQQAVIDSSDRQQNMKAAEAEQQVKKFRMN